MLDDPTSNHDDVTRETSDPHAETQHNETADSGWLDTNVGARADEWIGRCIGEFEIIRIIGTGGMGNVYEAKQMHPHRSVALKIVKSAAATPATLHRFEMESELLARLQHPGIAQVYDSGHQTQDDVLLPYFAMEYVPGSRSITDFAEDEHLSRDGRLALFLRVCEAVQYGHGRGIIHRDLKPSNILITSGGRPKVIDFGVALLAGSDDVEKTVTVAGRFVGTLQWSSPEQCGDDPHDVDVRTDVYSLGVLLFQLITGELPYELKGIPLYKAPEVIREKKPTPPRTIDATIPIEIDQILMKALSKERDSRYESVAAFATDIRLYLSSQPILANPPTAMHRLRLYAKRNQLKFRAAIIVFLALVIGLTGLVWGFVESEARQRDMKIVLQAEESARSIAEQKAYSAMISTAQAAISSESWGMARHHLAATSHAKRGWEWHYLHGLVDQSVKMWLIGDRPTSLVSSPTGEQFAITFEGGRVVLVDETRDVTRDLIFPSKVNAACFSQDGKLFILGMENGAFSILNLSEETMLIFNEKQPSIQSVVFLQDSTFATGHADGVLRVWNAKGEKRLSVDGNHGMILSLDYDIVEDTLAAGTIDGTVLLLKENVAIPTLLQNAHDGAVHAIHFVESGTLVSGSVDGNIVIRDLESNTHRIVFSGHGEVMDLASIDNLLATTGLDGAVRLWSTDDFTLYTVLRGHEDMVWSIGSLKNDKFVTVGKDGSVRWWSPSLENQQTYHASSRMPASDVEFVWNDVLVTVSEFDSNMQVIDLAKKESYEIPSTGSELSVVAFVPNTSYVVTGDLLGDVRLWDIDKLEQDKLLGSCNGQITAIYVSTHGKLIAAGTINGNICIFNRLDRRVLYEGDVSDSIVLAIACNENGTEFYISTIGGMLSAIDLKSGTILWSTEESRSDIVAMKYIRSQQLLLTATSSNTLQLIDTKDGAVLDAKNSTGGVLRDIALFNDESRFVTASSDGTVGIWDTTSFSLLASLPSRQSLECIAVSRDGYRLAIGGGNSSIQLLDGMSRRARLKNSTSENINESVDN